MFWEFFSLSKLVNHAEAMRSRHSIWLTQALRRSSGYPRIPTKPVGEGGFSGLMTTSSGRAWAEEWWADTLRSPDLDL
jgi:hypothetical protein